jgi:hypothetical protein
MFRKFWVASIMAFALMSPAYGAKLHKPHKPHDKPVAVPENTFPATRLVMKVVLGFLAVLRYQYLGVIPCS